MNDLTRTGKRFRSEVRCTVRTQYVLHTVTENMMAIRSSKWCQFNKPAVETLEGLQSGLLATRSLMKSDDVLWWCVQSGKHCEKLVYSSRLQQRPYFDEPTNVLYGVPEDVRHTNTITDLNRGDRSRLDHEVHRHPVHQHPVQRRPFHQHPVRRNRSSSELVVSTTKFTDIELGAYEQRTLNWLNGSLRCSALSNDPIPKAAN